MARLCDGLQRRNKGGSASSTCAVFLAETIQKELKEAKYNYIRFAAF